MSKKTKKDEYSDIALDGEISTWNLDAQGLIKGTYRGIFKFKCYLDPIEQISCNREYRALLGDNPSFVPEHENFLAYALTQLKYRIIEAPPFWTATAQNGHNWAGNVPDENILSRVLDAAVRSEEKFKLGLKDRLTKSVKSSRSKAQKIADGVKEREEQENKLLEDSED